MIRQALRNVYHAVFDPRRRRAFYSQFVRPGDLVFDVGANVGNYTEALLAVDAKVIAIEPDPGNLEVLNRRFLGKSVTIESCAMGEREGIAELHIAPGKGDRSTLSAQWAKSAECSEVIQVPIMTLDLIAERYGIPSYVKVDTEGYDAEVLRGMSFRPSMISFEFAPRALSTAIQCVEFLPGYSFNFVLGEKVKFAAPRWVDGREILELLSAVPTDINYGDVFARKR